MTKNSVISCVLTLLLIVWLAVMWPLSRTKMRAMPFGHMSCVIADTARVGFVNEADIRRECKAAFGNLDSLSRTTVDLHRLEQVLCSLPEIESAQVAVLSDGSLRLNVVPMVPVARVFERSRSYYINTAGKKIEAHIDYHIDVPVVSGYFDSIHRPEQLLPLLDYIKADPRLNALVSSVTTDSLHDIYLVPVIHGHLVNFGDTTLIADKFDRLRAFYTKVMPVKGWDYYRTVSLKWRGQVVATRRQGPVTVIPEVIDDDYNTAGTDSMFTTPLEYPKELIH